LRQAESAVDPGGKASNKSAAELAGRADLGIKTIAEGNSLKLSNVFSGGAAIKAGLAAGDQLVAIDGLKISPANLEKLLAQYSPDEEVEIHVFRRDELMVFMLTLQPAPLDTIELKLLFDIDAKTAARRSSWLNSH